MISSGPRFGFLGSTFASVKGFTFAFAICARATPGPATWYVSYSCRASSSSSALAHPYLNWSNVRVIARPRLSGFASTGPVTFSVDSGSGRTPRNGPGSMATEAADSPRSAIISVSRPPVGMAHHRRLLVELADRGHRRDHTRDRRPRHRVLDDTLGSRCRAEC